MKTVAVIGAGPIGLEAALALVDKKFQVIVIERGSQVAQNVMSWSHVQLFSPMKLNMSTLGSRLLGAQVTSPDAFLRGSEFREQYLIPLSKHLGANDNVQIKLNTNVVAISRETLPKGVIGTAKRITQRFRILTENTESSQEHVYLADYVIDATGSYGSSNAKHAGPGGAAAIGERALRRAEASANVPSDSLLHSTIPDILGSERQGFLPGSPLAVAVIGSGYSAVTALNSLEALATEVPDQQISVTWITRNLKETQPYELVENDPLPSRDTIARFGNDLSSGNRKLPRNFTVRYLSASTVQRMEQVGNQVEIEVSSVQDPIQFDKVLSLVGYKPDFSFEDELQVHLCWASQGPMKLAAALLAASGGGGDCMAQVVPGPDTLKSPEPGFYVIGSKSYGRGSAFLLRVGIEQVGHVVQLISSY